MTRLSTPLLLAASLGLAGCGSTTPLQYAPTVAVQPGPAAVSSVSVVDRRDEKPNRYATVRGGYGNPVLVMDAPHPVADEVQVAVTAALQARGMLGAPGATPYRIQVILRTLYGNTYITPGAYIDLDLQVADRSGRVIYSDTIKDERHDGITFRGFPFGDIDGLAKLVQTLLDSSIDRLLDKPGLRAVLGRSPALSRPAA